MKDNNNTLHRRGFIKRLGSGILATAAVASGCTGKRQEDSIVSGSSVDAEGGMTYRVHPESGDKVSILGYGCMRWPLKKVKGEDGKD